jgi:putative ABC transport system ATP-binding protein
MSEKLGMKLAVECRGIERWFGEGDARVQVLRGVDLNIGMGQLAMLVGPSGCGKTTLISIITGLLNASDGDVEVLGEKLSSLTNEQQIAFRQRDLVLSSSNSTCFHL